MVFQIVQRIACTASAGGILVQDTFFDKVKNIPMSRVLCRQETIDAELIIKTLQNFDKVINALPIEDQKDLFQLLFKEIRVWSHDPEKEKTPAKTTGAFVTKIRTKWYRIKLDLYQFPEIDTHYKSISCKKASSDFTTKWLPLVDEFCNFLEEYRDCR